MDNYAVGRTTCWALGLILIVAGAAMIWGFGAALLATGACLYVMTLVR